MTDHTHRTPVPGCPRCETSADEPLVDDEWARAAAVLGLVSTVLDTIDWDALDALTVRANSLGPILAPTEYRDSLATGTLSRNRRVINATRTYLAELRKIHTETQG